MLTISCNSDFVPTFVQVSVYSSAVSDSFKTEIENLRKEQSALLEQVSRLTSRFDKLEARLSRIEGGSSQPAAENQPSQVLNFGQLFFFNRINCKGFVMWPPMYNENYYYC